MNSLVDVEIIEALYAASRSGVKIRLNVRGVCTLRPGLPGTSENIEVVSIVDRFLEHSRVYLFQNGGDEDVYLASADWMPRNLDRRIELMFPIDDAAARQKVIFALRAMFRDTVKARWLGADGVYRRRRPRAGETKCRVQQMLQEDAKRAATAARQRGTVAFQPQEADSSETKAG
jgi:polyphosphate kinase